MRRSYNTFSIPDYIVRAARITLGNDAHIAVPYDMRNGFAVEIKAAVSKIGVYNCKFLQDTIGISDYARQWLCYEYGANSVSIRSKLETGGANAYAQFRNLITDTNPHIIKASNQYNYNGEHYRLIFDGQTKLVSWQTGTPGSYWADALTAYISSWVDNPTIVYYCKLYDKWGRDGLENVVNDLVPVGNTQTGEGGLLDLLTGELYWNIVEGGTITYEL